jgi:hypothetical protein
VQRIHRHARMKRKPATPRIAPQLTAGTTHAEWMRLGGMLFLGITGTNVTDQPSSRRWRPLSSFRTPHEAVWLRAASAVDARPLFGFRWRVGPPAL